MGLEGQGEKSCQVVSLTFTQGLGLQFQGRDSASPFRLISPGSWKLVRAPTQGHGKHEYPRHPLWEHSLNLGR